MSHGADSDRPSPPRALIRQRFKGGCKGTSLLGGFNHVNDTVVGILSEFSPHMLMQNSVSGKLMHIANNIRIAKDFSNLHSFPLHSAETR